jgi:hypothetical protein
MLLFQEVGRYLKHKALDVIIVFSVLSIIYYESLIYYKHL